MNKAEYVMKNYGDRGGCYPSRPLAKADSTPQDLHNVWFQKISRPPPRRELEIPGGWGGQRPRKFQKGGGLDHKITCQGVNIISFPTCVRTLLLTDLEDHF